MSTAPAAAARELVEEAARAERAAVLAAVARDTRDLELLFACFHPALALDAQVALTLRTVGGLTTGEIAPPRSAERDLLAAHLADLTRPGGPG